MENTNPHALNIFIAEDSPDIRTRLVALINSVEGVCICGEAETPAAAIDGILRTQPVAVILDIHLIGGNGLAVLREIHSLYPQIVFIVLTNHPGPQYRKAFMAAGANYFLDKHAEFLQVKDIVTRLNQAHC